MLIKFFLAFVFVPTCLAFDPLRLLFYPNIVGSLLAQDPGPVIEDPLPNLKVSESAVDGARQQPERELLKSDTIRRLIRATKEEEVDVPTVDAEGSVGGSSGKGVGVGVDVLPFVNVRVKAHRSSHLLPLTPDIGSILPIGQGGSLLPGVRHGGPLDLNINIPNIFRLRLNRDEDGGRKLGIGVLPLWNGPGLVSVGVDTRNKDDDDEDKK